ncbi:hypothetical protein NDU88_000768 [Pleurodeles waltl]|uniref:Uncharacterized protein n=1 Tax=Pleurodeles waltl TaxID=8319 RepID=A0AAV7TFR1_PLEWA|nr:hypothetical protein NDU88_000768 [Pleurodeles waltl]
MALPMRGKIKQALALAAIRDSETKVIPCIMDKAEQWVDDSQGIAAVFTHYYEGLYTARAHRDCESTGPLVAELLLPRLSDSDRAALDCAIMVEEVGDTLVDRNSGKNTGTGWLPCGVLLHVLAGLIR